MGKGTFLATVALLVAVSGAIVAFAAYFKRRNCALCDDFDDVVDDDASDLDYYATKLDEDDVISNDADGYRAADPMLDDDDAADLPVSEAEMPDDQL